MTVLAAEAAGGAASAEAGTAAAAGRTATASSSAAPRAASTPGARGKPGPTGPAGPQGSGSKRQSQGSKSKGKSGSQGGIKPKTGGKGFGGNAQPAILVEFVLAILLTAFTPFATSKNPQGLSPYTGSDILKLGALTLVYFILSLTSALGKNGAKFSAMFGLLILLGVGLNEAANLAAAFNLLAGVPGTSPGGGSGMSGSGGGSTTGSEGSGGGTGGSAKK